MLYVWYYFEYCAHLRVRVGHDRFQGHAVNIGELLDV